MKHIIIGTAGHIDHGKTALIRALTGRNTDRLKEEQRRGITIELGFTWFDMRDGTRCGIIDVPGHEKFVGTMVSGVVGMDLVLMVVAADEGIMPQTKEHLDILELLGIKKTIIVLNKCDLVDHDWLCMVEEDMREKLKGTILDEAPIVRVSAATGQGIEDLKALIEDMAAHDVSERDVRSIPRLPVDRVFSVSGFGTVVTGTLLSGTCCVGDMMEIYPGGKVCRIRSIQVHETDAVKCSAGQRAAFNLTGVKREEIKRGSVIAPVGSMRAARRADVKLSILRDCGRSLKNRARLHFYTGTCRVLCRAVLMDRDELWPGESGFAQLVFEEDVAVRRGDRYVIRFYSPVETIGGGIVLEPCAVKRKRFDAAAIRELQTKENGSLADVCEYRIKESAETLITLTGLAQATAHSKEELLPYLTGLAGGGRVCALPLRRDIWYWHEDSIYAAQQSITRELRRFHESYPYRTGMQKAELHSTCMKKVKQGVFDACMQLMADRGIIRISENTVSLSDFETARDQTFNFVQMRLFDTLRRAGYDFVRLSQIDFGAYPAQTVRDIAQVLIDENKLVILQDDYLTLAHTAEEAVRRIEEHFHENEILTYSGVRDMFATSRKCAKIIIAYTDEIRVTKRAGAETERVSAH